MDNGTGNANGNGNGMITNGNGTASDEKSGSKSGAQYHCDYCRSDITSQVRIKCAECKDFDLCLECFSKGKQVIPHKNTHPYRVMAPVTKAIFEVGWGADEELLLLEAIEMYGMGNWGDVSNHVGSKKPKQCEQHYYDIYLSSPSAPLPDISKDTPSPGPLVDASGAPIAPNDDKDSKDKKKGKKKSGVKPTGPKPKAKTGLGHLVGYLPERGDFETEYDNDAEQILADMEFKEEDIKWETELKLKVLEIYNSKLDARAERKKFILQRGLLERRDKKRSKEEKEVYNNMRVFARFHTDDEHEQFVQGLINEQRLRRRIEQLQQWRLNGIRTLADGEAFEAEKKKRESSAGGRKSREAAYLYDVSRRKRSADDMLDGDNGVKRKRNDTIDISGMEGFALLSEQERKLCSELAIIPQHYMIIKERLIRESYTRGFLVPSQTQQLIQIDVNKTSKLLDFFVAVGWVNSAPAIPPPSSSSSLAIALASPSSSPSIAAAVPAASSSSSSSMNAPSRTLSTSIPMATAMNMNMTSMTMAMGNGNGISTR